MLIVQVHPEDYLAKRAIYDVLNRSHSGHVRQAVLDFWRQNYHEFITHKKGGDTIFIIALKENNVIGISCTAILRNSRRCFNSLTVVNDEHRNRGIGTSLLKSKIKLIETRYPDSFLMCFVSKINPISLRMCGSAGLHLVDEGIREREGKESTEFYVLSNRRTLLAERT